MDVLEDFIQTTALICEPSRSKILWTLLDGRAYTASELAACADISLTAASNHLAKLLDAELLKVEHQGRHRYFTFANADVAYAVEALAQLSKNKSNSEGESSKPKGIKYCRSCYDHLAGYVGVQIIEAMERREILMKCEKHYNITDTGREWLALLGAHPSDYANKRRPLTRQCMDWSERRPHLAGQLGADLLRIGFERNWFKRNQFSRELTVTSKGRKELYDLLGLTI